MGPPWRQRPETSPIKSLFLEETITVYKVIGLGILSLALIAIDHLSDFLDYPRAGLSVLVTPIILIADVPKRTLKGVSEVVASRDDLQKDNRHLREEVLMLHAKTEKMAALTAENNRLRGLLGSAEKVEDNVLVAELIGVDPDPDRHIVIIDKGSSEGVFVGQPLLDAEGLMGQVIEAGPITSRVLLISDRLHSVPVQVVRSNLRLIARGTGIITELELRHVQDTADIVEGDLLVSSGLGGRFPVGYPVGVVSKIRHDPGKPFAVVRATPTARLDRTRHALLVFTEERLAKLPSGTSPESGG
jgi:rod shape-determining protein MreC